MPKSAGASGPSLSPSLAAWGLWRRRGEGRREGQKEVWGRHFCSHLPSADPCMHSTQPQPQRSPQSPSPGGWAEKGQAPPPGSPPGGEQRRKEGKKAGGREQGREAGGREEERGRREGGTEERRLNKEPRSWGWQGVQGRGGGPKGSGGTWAWGRGLGGRIAWSAPDLPG